MHQPRSHPVAVVRGGVGSRESQSARGPATGASGQATRSSSKKPAAYEVQLELLARITETARGIRSPSATPRRHHRSRLPPKPKATAPNWNSSAVRPCPARATIAPPCAEPWARIARESPLAKPRDSTGTPRPVDRQYHQHHSHQPHRGAVPHHAGV